MNWAKDYYHHWDGMKELVQYVDSIMCQILKKTGGVIAIFTEK